MYHFSENTTVEKYGIPMYAILDGEKVAAYSQSFFEIPDGVIFRPSINGPAYIFSEAIIRGGEIWGGEIWGGVIRGGVIRGGEIWGGVIRGGEIWGGVYETTLLQIQGSRHFCYLSPTDSGEFMLGIGCYSETIQWWADNYERIGKNEGYTTEEIAEYGEYVALYAKTYAK